MFRADAAKLPAYAGCRRAGRPLSCIYRVSKVIDVESVDAEQRKALAKQLEQIRMRAQEAAEQRRRRQPASRRRDVKVDEKKTRARPS